MKSALLALYQQRMDKCQNEQFWAVTAFAAANAVVIAESSTFAAKLPPSAIVSALGSIGLATFMFVLIRMNEYYLYRRDMARLLTDIGDVPDYMKDEKSVLCVNSVLWIAVFGLVIGLCFLATFACL